MVSTQVIIIVAAATAICAFAVAMCVAYGKIRQRRMDNEKLESIFPSSGVKTPVGSPDGRRKSTQADSPASIRAKSFRARARRPTGTVLTLPESTGASEQNDEEEGVASAKQSFVSQAETVTVAAEIESIPTENIANAVLSSPNSPV